ncbi:MAG: PepSY-like domain-containing protein [Saprospiraceae bacterium]|nr:PepSY-like domain-containing protein [Saprospiraceae bacterium]MCB9326805.1 PepSY-like domain-containing protein [Lewinellaceae bacterium]
MKLSTSFGLLLFFVASACAQKNIPNAVKAAFAEKFPGATSIKWEKEDGEFEAEFKWQQSEYSANYSMDGKWMETEKSIDKKDLPEAVTATLADQFKDYKIKEANLLSNPEMEVAYEVELKSGLKTIEVLLDASGKVIKKEKEEQDGEEEDDDDGGE